MKKYIVVLIGVALLCVGNVSYAEDESIELTTYYPAPYGDYDSIALTPTPSATPPSNPTEGQIYYNSDDDELKIFGEDPDNSDSLKWLGIRSSEVPYFFTSDVVKTDDPDERTWFSTQYMRIGDIQIAWGQCYLYDIAWTTGKYIMYPAPFAAAPRVVATPLRWSTFDPAHSDAYTTGFQITERSSLDRFEVVSSKGLEEDDEQSSLAINWTAIGRWR